MGPLTGLRVIELAGVGPAPFAGMMLADMGADVVRVDRPAGQPLPVEARHDLLGRGKRSAIVDLSRPGGAGVVLALCGKADVLIEGFRPGVAERLGVGPQPCHAANPALVYGRMTGWGQTGPLASTAGHDITFLARSGVLHAIGPAAAPVPPVNLLGDYGAGGMLLVAGVLAALWQVHRGGRGQVVDAAVLDGAALLATQLFGFLHAGAWQDRREANLLDGRAPFYRVYPASDGRFLAVGPLEPKFFHTFIRLLGLDPGLTPEQYLESGWSTMDELIGARLGSRTRDEWMETFDGSDACVAPVLSLSEAASGTDPQLAGREVFVDLHGVRQPAPAPRFSDTPTRLEAALPPPYPGEHTQTILTEWDVTGIDRLIADGVAHQR